MLCPLRWNALIGQLAREPDIALCEVTYHAMVREELSSSFLELCEIRVIGSHDISVFLDGEVKESVIFLMT